MGWSAKVAEFAQAAKAALDQCGTGLEQPALCMKRRKSEVEEVVILQGVQICIKIIKSEVILLGVEFHRHHCLFVWDTFFLGRSEDLFSEDPHVLELPILVELLISQELRLVDDVVLVYGGWAPVSTSWPAAAPLESFKQQQVGRWGEKTGKKCTHVKVNEMLKVENMSLKWFGKYSWAFGRLHQFLEYIYARFTFTSRA